MDSKSHSQTPARAESSGRGVTRRTALGTAGIAALVAAAPSAVSATSGLATGTSQSSVGEPVTRPLPGSSQRVPVIGLGSFMTFDRRPGTDRSFISEVLAAFYAGGGRVVDTSALYGASERNIGDFAAQQGITDELVLTDKSWNCGEYLFDDSHVLRQYAQSQRNLHRRRLDVVGIHSMTNVGMVLPVLRRLKEQGQIRYVGLTSHEPYQYAGMIPLVSSGLVDFIQARYSIFQRTAEEALLDLAADNGVGVMVNMALEKGRLHQVIGDRPVPEFAREQGCESWAQYFLSYVAAHPAVTCVVPATTSVGHLQENLRTMFGPLPDDAQRRRMLEHVQAIPEFGRIASMPWYPGKTFTDGFVRLPQPHPAG